MKVKYAMEKLDKSIFLAGPTPRRDDVVSWRPEAIQLMSEIGFDGTVLIPESADWSTHEHYDQQIEWEWEGISSATVVAFWVPRNMLDMPALTTNVEFGLTVASQKAVLGFPPDAPSCRYLAALARRYNIPVRYTLEGTLRLAIDKAQNPHPFMGT